MGIRRRGGMFDFVDSGKTGSLTPEEEAKLDKIYKKINKEKEETFREINKNKVCDFCGKKIIGKNAVLFRCTHCHEYFCAEHARIEIHKCFLNVEKPLLERIIEEESVFVKIKTWFKNLF